MADKPRKELIEELASELNVRARMVLGAHSWDRPETDPRIQNAVEGAMSVLIEVMDHIGPPHISPATTVSPDDILTLSWRVASLNDLSVTFYGDDTCRLAWGGESKGYVPRDMPVRDVLVVDLPYVLDNLRRRFGPRNGGLPALRFA